MSGDWHVYPIDDVIEHETSKDECTCGPDAELTHGPEGDIWIYRHHSLDAREQHEGQGA